MPTLQAPAGSASESNSINLTINPLGTAPSYSASYLTPSSQEGAFTLGSPSIPLGSSATTSPSSQPQFTIQDYSRIEELKEDSKANRKLKEYQIKWVNWGRFIAMILFFSFIVLYWFKFKCGCWTDAFVTLFTFAPIAFIYFGYDLSKFWKKNNE